jgi:hypothetical protein
LVLLNDILDFSKIEAGRLELESIDFDVPTLIEESLQTLAHRADEKGLEVATLVDSRVPARLRGDPSRLRQVLLNLASNAIKFTQRGEVTAEVTLVEAAEDSCTLRFSVHDTGPGIPEERMGRLFKVFSQVDSSTTRKFGGTGLGLAISKQLVNLMGGEIGANSEEGVGSTFWFELPLERALNVDAPAAPLPRAMPFTRMLVVDDNDMRPLLGESIGERSAFRHSDSTVSARERARLSYPTRPAARVRDAPGARRLAGAPVAPVSAGFAFRPTNDFTSAQLTPWGGGDGPTKGVVHVTTRPDGRTGTARLDGAHGACGIRGGLAEDVPDHRRR